MGYKICVYAICKNESAFVERWMESMSEADIVCVTDTGSSDDTAQKLQSKGARVFSALITPWRFDAARNISLDNVPQDVDICVCTDLDEVFAKGWREKLEKAWSPSFSRARYLFTSDYNADGTPSKQFIKEKIHKRDGFKWVHPVHEVLEYSGNEPDRSVFIPDIMLYHYPDRTKPRTQYLPLLELSARENPDDSQTVFWLGREYFYHEKHDQCIETLQKYLMLSGATWGEERSAAMQLIAVSYEKKSNLEEARAWLFRAIAECPNAREPYLKAARFGYSHSDWPLTYAMVQEGLSISEKTGSYLSLPECWGAAFYDLGAISSFRLDMLEKSREYAAKALEMDRGNRRLQNNLWLIEAKIAGDAGEGGGKDELI